MNDPEIQYYKNKNQLKLFVAIKKPNLTIAENQMIVECIVVERKKAETMINPLFQKETQENE